MTIRLLCAYGRSPANAIITLDPGTEAGLIASKLATATLAGGNTYFAPIELAAGRSASLKIGEQVFVPLSEGQALNITGGAGAAGVAYLLDPILGGTNSTQSWAIGAGALAAIGPYDGQRRVLVTCSAGSISATVNAAVLSPSGAGAGAIATVVGNFVVGQALVATLPPGVVGTLQFTRSLTAAPFTKTSIAGAVANSVNSLSYTLQPGDATYAIGCDASNQISPSSSGIVAALAAAVGYARKVMGLSMPFGDTTTGILTSNNSWRTVRTFPKPFKRIRCYLFNMSTTATLAGAKAAWSPSESLAGVQRPTIGGVTSDASQVSFLFGGSEAVTLPMATVSNIPSITVSDWLVTPSIARTDDVGGYPLGYFTEFYTTGTQIGYSDPQLGFGAFLEGLPGMKHKFRVYTQAVDAVANPAAFTVSSQTNRAAPMGIEVEYYDGVRTMIVAGDSTMQGTGNTANAGAGLMALANLDSQSMPADSFVLAQSGSPASRMYTKLTNMLALTTPDTIYFQPFSVNDTSNYASSATATKTRAANLVAYCAANSINLILDTPLPIFIAGSAAITGTELAALTDMTTYLLGLGSPTVKVIDLSALHSSLYSGVYSATYGYDGYHPNPAGHLYRANALAAAITSLG